jgi:hypothetical protein
MLKKITTKQDQKIEAAARAQFATDVIDLYQAKMAGRPDTRSDPKVRTVAIGLAALKQAVDLLSHKHRNNPEALIASGAPVADEIITALTTTARADHPLWKYIAGLRTSLHRATAGQQRRREMFAGVALAYKDAVGGSLRGATEAVCKGIRAPDFPVNPEQLRKWVDRNEKAARVHANRFLADAKALGGPAAALPRCVIIAGRNAMRAILVVPS